MAARKSVLVVSVAPSNAIANIASELASRGHFTIFASVNPSKHFKDSSYSGNLQNIEIDPQSPASIFRASIAVASTLSARGFSGLDVLINDVGVGSSLALLDVMIDESPETYNSKISDALSLATSFASLLATSRGKVVNISSSGAMISAPCMNKKSHFSAERAITGISEHMRLEDSLRDVEIETVMLETVPSATQAIPRVILPERSSYSSCKESRVTVDMGSMSTKPVPRATVNSLVSEPNSQHKPGWLWEECIEVDREDHASRLEKGLAAPAVW